MTARTMHWPGPGPYCSENNLENTLSFVAFGWKRSSFLA